METRIKIINSACSAYSNGLHAQFQDVMYGIVNDWSGGLKVINIKVDMMREWRSLIDVELEISLEATASMDTKRLADLDKQRDDLTSHLFSTIRTSSRLPVAAMQAAGEELNIIVKKYTGLQTKSYELQTGQTKGLLNDLDKPTAAAHLATLGLTAIVAQLRQVNDDYGALRTTRSSNSAASKLPPAKQVRAQSDEMFARVCLLIEASYLMTSVASSKAIMEELANAMNKRISDFRTTHKASTGRGGSASTPTNPSTPSGDTPSVKPPRIEGE